MITRWFNPKNEDGRRVIMTPGRNGPFVRYEDHAFKVSYLEGIIDKLEKELEELRK